MDGGKCTYQPDTAAERHPQGRQRPLGGVLRRHPSGVPAELAHAVDNIFSYSASKAATTCSRAACSSPASTTSRTTRCRATTTSINNGLPAQIRQFNTPVNTEEHRPRARLLPRGFVDEGRLTLSASACATTATRASCPSSRRRPPPSPRPVRWRLTRTSSSRTSPCGAPARHYDLMGNGSTALKASYAATACRPASTASRTSTRSPRAAARARGPTRTATAPSRRRK